MQGAVCEHWARVPWQPVGAFSPAHLGDSDQNYWFFGITAMTFSKVVVFCCRGRIFYLSNITIKFIRVQSHNGILITKGEAQLVSFRQLTFGVC